MESCLLQTGSPAKKELVYKTMLLMKSVFECRCFLSNLFQKLQRVIHSSQGYLQPLISKVICCLMLMLLCLFT